MPARIPDSGAIVLAAGSGTRFGSPKQHSLLGGRQLIEWSLEVARETCELVVLVVPSSERDGASSWGVEVVVGGRTRSESVRAGLEGLPPEKDVVLVHDAARPLATAGLWRSVAGALRDGADAAIPVVPVTDTIKEVGEAGQLRTLDRDRLVRVQTPQAFRRAALEAAHARADDATDDAALVERAGGQVVTVDGEELNMKVTTRTDLLLVSALAGAACR